MLRQGTDDLSPAVGQSLPGKLAEKCPKCRELLVGKEWRKNLKVCLRCGYHFRLSARERIEFLVDEGSFQELDAHLLSVDPLHFVYLSPSHDGKMKEVRYEEKLKEARKETGINEAVIVGTATIEGNPLALAVLAFEFIGGSMASVVGEKLTRTMERALADRSALLIVSASGGARMHEGLFSLLQMAKTSSMLARLGEARVPYISLLTDPTTGGISASFAFLGDVILAEPGALIGFAGPRVIEQFMHMRLPSDTNTAEFVLAHGMLDQVVPRRLLRPTLARILRLYAGR
ncbi:MAG TPA: acetyl-CoA carboxylase, carboxyltransferase subunit beta [Ktedonobacterales bacterium]|jgi:acetyl-CoA carboxylase carboxyl transferase subunit beta